MSKAFTAEFKLEAAKAMNASLSAINRWIKSLRMKRQGKTPPELPLTPEQTELREKKKENTTS